MTRLEVPRLDAVDREWAVRFARNIASWANSLADCIEQGEDANDPGWWEQEQGHIQRNGAFLAAMATARIHGRPCQPSQDTQTAG